MRIPPSTIVMSLVTAMPFGLAIRDTLKHQNPSSEYRELERYQDAEQAVQQRELEEANARAAEEESKMNAARRTLIGERPGTPGVAFESVKLGWPVHGNDEITVPDGKLSVTQNTAGGVLIGIFVELSDDCSKLDRQLVSAWGRSSSTPAVWLDPVDHQRAVFDLDKCKLLFDRYADAQSWVNALPFTLVGRTGGAFRDKLGDKLFEDSDVEFGWTDVGVGAGAGPTSYRAGLSIKDGKVSSVSADVETDEDSAYKIAHVLENRFGAAKTDDSGAMVWSRKPALHLTIIGGHVRLEVGTLP